MDMTHRLKAGAGYDTAGGGFGRVVADTAVRIAANEYARPNHAIVYTTTGKRWHVRQQDLVLCG